MSLFGKNPNEVAYEGEQKHIADVLKNRSTNDTLIFKNPEEDFNNGSTLVVEPGEQAIFMNEGRIEQVFDPGTYTLLSENYPFISRLRNALSGAVSSFHCLVFFVRTASGHEIKWGTDAPIKVYDKALADQFTGIGIETEVRARGAYRVKVSDAGVLLTNLIGSNYDLTQQESLRDFFRSQFLGNIVSLLTQELTAWNGPLLAVPANAVTYAAQIEQALAPIIADYGLQMLNFSISALEIVDNEQRREAQDLASENRRNYFGKMAEGAGNAAFAQGQQQAYQTYGTNYQQAEVLNAMNETAANPGSDGSALLGAGMGLTMGAGLGQVVPGMLNETMQAASGPASGMPGTQAGAQGQQSAQASAEAVAPQTEDSPVERLGQLKKLLDAELISQEEFDAKKAEILKSL